MPDVDLSPATVEATRRGMRRITDAGERGAAQVTVEETVAMARTIAALLIHIGRLEADIDALRAHPPMTISTPREGDDG